MTDSSNTRGGHLRESRKSDQAMTLGRRLIVTVGIDAYRDLPKLHNAVNDAHNVQRLFVDNLGYEAPFAPLTDGQATQQGITTLLLDGLRSELKPDDTLVLFFAGHGAVREDDRGGPVGFLAPVDAEKGTWSRYLRIDTLLDEVGRLPALHILVIIDTCFSGHALGGTFARQVAPGESGRAASRRVITSARAHQVALDGFSDDAGGHTSSPFTSVLLDAFTLQDTNTARADFDQNGAIIGIELGIFIQLEFGKTSQYEQMPDFGAFHYDERGEFVIATRGTAQRPDDPRLIRILQDAQGWLQSRGDRAYLYRGEQLTEALAWRAQQDDPDVREEVDTFLNAGRHWRRLRHLAAVAAAVVGIVILYVAGVGIYRWRLKVSARAPTAQYETAMVRMGIAGEAVRVEGFRLDLHEVSAAQYRLCYQAKACDPPIGIPDYREIALSDEEKLLPVVEVTMFNARDYCEWQGGRLPTVAEWEYAVRGTTYRTWPWGEEKPTRAHANVDLPNNRGPQPFTDSLVSVQDPAYSKGRTPEGVWHLLGNAWEWTSTLITGCPHDAQGRFSEVHLCKTWNGDDSASGLFAAGLSYNHQLLPGDEQRVSEHINVGATIFGDDLGFRCAYDVP